jgi:hypothetical protein
VTVAADPWAVYETRPEFRAWVNDIPELEETDRYAVIKHDLSSPSSGLAWVHLRSDGRKVTELTRSGGAFYDGADDHPEGAIEWASWGARKTQEERAAYWREFDARWAAEDAEAAHAGKGQ